jgi:hypothetical protein
MVDVSTLADGAALQHKRGTIPAGSPRFLWQEQLKARAPATSCHRMSTPVPREYFIQGLTKDGKTFRPSDWAERLAGAMSCFRPEGSVGGRGAFIGYSPYCVPRTIDGVKCVIVNEALRSIEPMAWDFVMHFARDNELQVIEACLLPDPPKNTP